MTKLQVKQTNKQTNENNKAANDIPSNSEYSYLSNKRGGWNKRGGGEKNAK